MLYWGEVTGIMMTADEDSPPPPDRRTPATILMECFAAVGTRLTTRPGELKTHIRMSAGRTWRHKGTGCVIAFKYSFLYAVHVNNGDLQYQEVLFTGNVLYINVD